MSKNRPSFARLAQQNGTTDGWFEVPSGKLVLTDERKRHVIGEHWMQFLQG